jgi:hypothetical protein
VSGQGGAYRGVGGGVSLDCQPIATLLPSTEVARQKKAHLLDEGELWRIEPWGCWIPHWESSWDYCPREKLTVMVVWTSTGWPLRT